MLISKTEDNIRNIYFHYLTTNQSKGESLFAYKATSVILVAIMMLTAIMRRHNTAQLN